MNVSEFSDPNQEWAKGIHAIDLYDFLSVCVSADVSLFVVGNAIIVISQSGSRRISIFQIAQDTYRLMMGIESLPRLNILAHDSIIQDAQRSRYGPSENVVSGGILISIKVLFSGQFFSTCERDRFYE